MKFSISEKSVSDVQTNAVILPIFQKEDWEKISLDHSIKDFVFESAINSEDFKAKKSELMFLSAHKTFPNLQRIFLLGLGEQDKYNWDELRNGCGKLIKTLKKYPIKKVSFLARKEIAIKDDLDRLGQTIVEGMRLGIYKFDPYKSETDEDEPSLSIEEIELVEIPKDSSDAVKSGVDTGEILSEAVKLARDLGNHPANIATPKMLAETATSVAEQLGMKCEILSKQKMKSLKMNALLGVAQGSNEPPNTVILDYNGGNGEQKTFVFVGKGVTFDSGGISLKPSRKMDEMKYDMCGGGIVIAIMQAVAKLKLPFRVIGIVPAVENLPSGNAIKPGDVITSMSGKTIEVINTDAEGRLILADAMTYAERFQPDTIIDLATLTGAVEVAIGNEAAGMMGNDEELIAQLKSSSAVSGERVWQFPLYEEYSDQIKSDIADIKNIGDRGAGVTVGGAFLSKFAEKYKWIHLDIAGVAWTTKELPIIPKGASGFGVRLLFEWLKEKVRK